MKRTIIFLFIFSINQVVAGKQVNIDKSIQHQFDFWLGKWDVYKYGTDTLAGKSHIESIIDSVGVLENYSVVAGKYKGKSLNKYNPDKNRWEQYWIDNSGLTLFLTGGIVKGKMILTDKENGDPKKGLNQIVWEKLPDGSVRQTWNLSKDNGKTWSLLFDGLYKKSISPSQRIESKNPFEAFENLIGGRWVTEGTWERGGKFQQEKTHTWELTKRIMVVKTKDFVDATQYDNSVRNYGIRSYDSLTQKMNFYEFNVFKTAVVGYITVEGKNMYYHYEYTPANGKTVKLTDAWIYIDANTYDFKIGILNNDKWEKLYLSTKYYRKPDSK